MNPGTSGPGSLVINGDYANLAGILAVVPINTTLALGQKLPGFLTADSVQGAFDSILLPTGFRGRVIDNQGTLILIAPGSYSQVAQSPNQLRAARALDQWIGIETGDTGEVTLAHRGAIPGSLRSHRPRMVFFCSPSASSKVRPAASSSINNLVPHASLLVPPFAFKGVEPSPIMALEGGAGLERDAKSASYLRHLRIARSTALAPASVRRRSERRVREVELLRVVLCDQHRRDDDFFRQLLALEPRFGR
jgi:hypothetical protein